MAIERRVEIACFFKVTRICGLWWAGIAGVFSIGCLWAHQISAVAAHAGFGRDGSYQFELSLDVTGSPDPVMNEKVSPEEAALAYLRDALEFRFDDTVFAPSFGPLRVVPRKDPLDPGAEVMRLETTASGRIPQGAKAFQVRLSPETEVALVMMVSKDGIAQRRAQTLFAGEVSRPIDLGFVGESVRPGDPFAKEAAAEEPGPTPRDAFRAGAGRMLAPGGRCVLLLVLIFLWSGAWRQTLAQWGSLCGGVLAGHLMVWGAGLALGPALGEWLLLVALAGVALHNVLRFRGEGGRLRGARLTWVGLAGLLLGLGAGTPDGVRGWTGLASYQAGVWLVGAFCALFVRLVLGSFEARDWYRQRLVVPLSFAGLGLALFWAVLWVLLRRAT